MESRVTGCTYVPFVRIAMIRVMVQKDRTCVRLYTIVCDRLNEHVIGLHLPYIAHNRMIASAYSLSLPRSRFSLSLTNFNVECEL